MAAGGTGGHFYPGLALAERIKKKEEKIHIAWIGSQEGKEKKVISQLGIDFWGIELKGFLGKGWLEKLEFLIKFGISLSRTFFFLRQYQPDAIVATGSYISAPVIVAGWALGYPVLILEQNIIPGLTNRLLSRLAKYICLPHLDAARFFPGSREKKKIWGNPVRAAILNQTKEEALAKWGFIKEKKTILFLGGSGGAEFINQLAAQITILLEEEKVPVQIIHLTGEKRKEVAPQKRSYQYVSLRKRFFLASIEDAYWAADLIISRAGGSTLAEITAIGRPAILIPFPGATYNHQYYNALTLAKAGAALLLPQNQITPEKLKKIVLSLLGDEKKLKKMEIQSKKLGFPQAGEKITALIQQLLNQRR